MSDSDQILLAPHVAGVHDRESPRGHEAASKLVLLPRNRGQLAAVDRIRDDSDLARCSPRRDDPPSHPLPERLDLARRAVQSPGQPAGRGDQRPVPE